MSVHINPTKIGVRIDSQFKIATDYLLEIIPEEQFNLVFNQKYCDIEPEFLGFIDTYYLLAKLIPTDFTIIDFGCAYAPQCYFFKDHHKYIGVDISPETIKFSTDNSEFYDLGIEKYIQENILSINQGKTFAICNYVPNWYSENIKLVKENFNNIYTFYPL